MSRCLRHTQRICQRCYALRVRPPTSVAYEPPTEEEKRLRATVVCVDCEREWPVRLAHSRARCLNCDRRKRRETKANERARARGDQPASPTRRPLQVNGRDFVVTSAFVNDLTEGRVPPEVVQEIDALIEQAARRR